MPCRQDMQRTFLPACLLAPRLLASVLSVLALAAAAVSTASAEPATKNAAPAIKNNETFKSMIGKWEISNADHDRSCVLTFKSDQSGALFKLDADKACTVQMPELKDVAGWTIGGLDLVKLIDAKGKSLFEFSEVENGIFEAQRPGEGIFFMQNSATTTTTASVSLDQMAGDWSVVRGSGNTVCVITLTNNTAADDDGFLLTVKPGCQTFVTGFNPAAWYLDRGELVLKSSKAGRYWRFEANNPTTWQRVPEGNEKVNLVRQ
ncbi:MAG: AprI/Inh family metalloprotease inhibitor [Bradyrhizobiaceae bacterium]|nr:AprI/Inh family metalloprotease inhibitor [Bradyrhizobiaceae bacterium]